MYQYDHRLNERYVHEHHQDIVRWVQQERLAREIKDAQGDPGMVLRLRAVLFMVIHRMIG
jgi:hypothetical protein